MGKLVLGFPLLGLVIDMRRRQWQYSGGDDFPGGSACGVGGGKPRRINVHVCGDSCL